MSNLHLNPRKIISFSLLALVLFTGAMFFKSLQKPVEKPTERCHSMGMVVQFYTKPAYNGYTRHWRCVEGKDNANI